MLTGNMMLPDGSAFEYWEDETDYKKMIHVDCKNPVASDGNSGEADSPLKTISRAAKLAQPGWKVLIHGGTYRECVRPKMGGHDEKSMICYEAVPGEQVYIKGSVAVSQFFESHDWTVKPVSENTKKKTLFYTDSENKADCSIWEIRLNPEDFKGYNPFLAVNIIHDRLFIEYGKTDMTPYLNRRGMVFIDGKPLKQVASYYQLADMDGSYWAEEDGMKIHIRLKGDANPSEHVVEVSNLEQCFAPDKPFLNYIHLKGITVSQAANGGPVPQKGLISCGRGHHWLIEGCTVEWANTVGIDCGNECWNHPLHDNQTLGHSIIRNNRIFQAGVCGIAGIGADSLLIEENKIEGTGWQRMELSWEAAGIKLHNAANTLIQKNMIQGCIGCDSLWLDLQNRNTRISQNLFLDGIESREHIFIECSRDSENLLDHNIIWNVEGRYNEKDVREEPGSVGWYKTREYDIPNGYGIYLEGTDRLRVEDNLIGKCRNAGFYANPVAFRMSSGRGGTSMKNALLNNIFYECGEAAVKFPTKVNDSEGNVFIGQPAGFLRILYPEPEMCLDLPAWQEFLGFDLNGSERQAKIEIYAEKLEMKVTYSDNQEICIDLKEGKNIIESIKSKIIL